MPYITVDVMLGVARQFVTQRTFDPEAAAGLLTSIATEGLDAETAGAIRHASRVCINTIGDSGSRIVEARFALARVVSLLERQTAGVRTH